jgi:hypothetical protein
LAEEDWDAIDYALFGVAERTRHSLLDERRRLAGVCPNVNIFLALQFETALDLICRYDPPLATSFGLDDGFFVSPRKFHVRDQQIVENGEEIVLSMDSNAGLFVAELEFVVASVRSVSLVFLQFVSAIDEPDAKVDWGYDNVGGKAVFKVKPGVRGLCRAIRITFMVEQKNRFVLESKKASGFVACW